MLNLLGNAVKFTDHGEVTLRMKLKSHEGNRACFSIEIKDTGIGISETEVGKLFKTFSQGDGSTTRKFGGTGLGLAISKRLVEIMDGEIGVESEPDRGSTFWFSVMLDLQRCETPVEVIEERHRVLIVDGLSAVRKSINAYLKALYVDCSTSATTEQAFEVLKEAAADGDPFTLVLLDGGVKRMDPVQFAKSLRSEGSVPLPRLVLLTHIGEWLAESMRSIGFETGLMKPVKKAALLQCVKAVSTGEMMNMEKNAADLEEALSGGVSAMPAKSPAEETMLAELRVLVAEDHPVNQMVITRQLRKLEIKPEVASNGKEALEKLDDEAFDLILMDCQMPVLDGLCATRTIRERELAGYYEGRPPVIIIAMTANAMEGDKEMCLEVGMDGYLSKPVSVSGIRDALESHVELRREAVLSVL